MKLIITLLISILLCACGSSSSGSQNAAPADSTEQVVVQKLEVTTIPDSLVIK